VATGAGKAGKTGKSTIFIKLGWKSWKTSCNYFQAGKAGISTFEMLKNSFNCFFGVV